MLGQRYAPSLQLKAGQLLHELGRFYEAYPALVTAVELAFCGDTRIDVLEEPLVQAARRLVLEVTFLDEAVRRERSRATGHVHLDDVVERAHLLQHEAILFTHFSHRYSAGQIVDLLDRRLPESLRSRVQPLLAGFR